MRPALLVIGHGTKSERGCEQFGQLVERVQLRVPYADVAGGFLELAPPPIQDAVHRLVEVGPGAVWVVGCAPTALFELISLGVDPALVIGLPVGFVGAVESKAALRDSGLPAVSNTSEKGGSAVASAALNALLYAAPPAPTSPPAPLETP